MSYLVRIGYYAISKGNAGWFRITERGPGLHWTCRKPMFSERNGYRKPFMRFGKWRFFYLARVKRMH